MIIPSPHKLIVLEKKVTITATAPSPSSSREPGKAPTNSVAKRRQSKNQKNALKDQEVLKKLRDICTNVDPSQVYIDITKIGQGYIIIITI